MRRPARSTRPSRRRRRSRRSPWLKTEITRIHQDNYQVYGAREFWRQLQRDGHRVARCTVERLMRELGTQGARRGRRICTTVRYKGCGARRGGP
ncbi:IS3 family transposase [Actinomadura luteofluorescens]|uniref:IS3 family transposase n=1 Tax=Actinomadura luteofluorescens TaxID=46163 RepID=UPI003D8F94F4